MTTDRVQGADTGIARQVVIMNYDHGLRDSGHLRTNIYGDQAPSTDTPNTDTIAVCEALARQRRCTSERLGVQLSIPPWVADAQLRSLWRRGFLKRASWPRNTYYVTPKGFEQLETGQV